MCPEITKAKVILALKSIQTNKFDEPDRLQSKLLNLITDKKLG